MSWKLEGIEGLCQRQTVTLPDFLTCNSASSLSCYGLWPWLKTLWTAWQVTRVGSCGPSHNMPQRLVVQCNDAPSLLFDNVACCVTQPYDKPTQLALFRNQEEHECLVMLLSSLSDVKESVYCNVTTIIDEHARRQEVLGLRISRSGALPDFPGTDTRALVWATDATWYEARQPGCSNALQGRYFCYFFFCKII